MVYRYKKGMRLVALCSRNWGIAKRPNKMNMEETIFPRHLAICSEYTVCSTASYIYTKQNEHRLLLPFVGILANFSFQTSCKMLSCNPQISPCGRCKSSEKQGKDKINRQFFAFKEICVIKEKLSVDRFWLYHSSPTWQNVKLYILLARIPYFLSNSLLNGNTGILVLKNKLEGWYSDKYRNCCFQKW